VKVSLRDNFSKIENMKDKDELQSKAHKATIAVARMTMVALILGLITFIYTLHVQRSTADTQSDAAAVEILAKHYEMIFEHKGLDAQQKKDRLRYFSLFAAETIYRRRPEDKGWKSSAATLIKEEFGEGKFECADFDDDFVNLVKETLKRDDVCE
jgi:hypothetical protein